MIIKFERSKKERKTKGKMARRLVYFCIGFLTVTALWAMTVTTLAGVKGWEVDLSGYLSAVLTYTGAAFGGELLFLLVKRVFAKPTDNTETEE
jgi:hypothetical protein